MHLLADDDLLAAEVDKFITCFSHRWKYEYRTSELAAERRRFEHTRLPVNLPQEDVKKLRVYIEQELNTFISMDDISPLHYVRVRNLVLSRILLLNGKRSNEPSRLTIKEMRELLEGKWVRIDQNETESEALKNYTIGYAAAKNPKKPVDVIVPKSLNGLINYLLNPEVRKEAGVWQCNDFAFPSLSSNNKASGYHDFRKICSETGVNISSCNMTLHQ